MAGDWIKMRGNLWDDPRVARVCDVTSSTEATVVGALYWLWSTADQHSKDGVMPGLTLRSIDRKTGVTGFADALISIGWLADHPEGVRIPHFEEHNGASAKSRSMTAKRVANHKANAKVTVDALPELDSGVTDALPREEKRREEKELTNPYGLVVASDPDDELAQQSRPAIEQATEDTASKCPHQEIIALYHEVLPQCPQVRGWTPARAVQLRARWNEDKKRQNLDYWRRFFEYVAACDFLVGKVPGRNGNPFFADLEWIVKTANFTKIREGKYAKS